MQTCWTYCGFTDQTLELLLRDTRYHVNSRRDLVDANGSSLYSLLVGLTASERDRIVEDLIDEYEVRSIVARKRIGFWRLLDAAGVRELNSHPLIDIEAHGHGHFLLDRVPESEAIRDLTRCRDCFREYLSRDVSTLAFPAGSYTERTKEIARQLGFRRLVAEQYRTADDIQDPDMIRRITISGTTSFYSNVLHYAASLHRSNCVKS